MKRYFADYPLDERKALWEKYLPRVQNEFDDYNYDIARDSFAETFPDYMNMTEFEGVPFDPKDRSHVALANMFGWDDSYWDDWEKDYVDTESQGEAHDTDNLKAIKKSAGIREMIARDCFEKTGRIPDVDFMDGYSFEDSVKSEKS